MKKILSIFTALTIALVVNAAIPEKLYLTPNSNWTQANARFAAYFFGNGEKWVGMTTVAGETDLYEVTVPSGYTKVIFCRMNPSASANNWSNKWNQSGDLTIPTDGKDHFIVKSGSWDGATTTWSTYTPPVYTIAGSPAVLGSGWSTDDANNDMTKQNDGTYTLVKENVELAVGTTYEYKVVRNHSWDWSYPNANATFSVDKSGLYNVTFTFDGTTSLEAVTVLIKEEIIIPTVALAGTMNGWSTTANVLVLSADSLTASTTIALQANTTDSIKIVLDGNWLGYNGTLTRVDSGQPRSFESGKDNCVLKADVAGDYIFTWNFANSQLIVIYPEKPDTPTPDPEPEQKVIYLNTGGKSFWEIAEAKFFVHAWGNGVEDLDAQMTQLEGNIYQVTISAAYTDIIFLRQNPSATEVDWKTSEEGGMLWNKTADLSIDGNCYKITGWGNDTPICSGEWVNYEPGVGETIPPTPENATISLAGSMNGWNSALSTFVKADDGLTASVMVYMEADTYSFKVVVNDTWLGSQETMTREHCTNWTLERGDGSDKYNCHIVADQIGEYEFVWTYATNQLSVNYPAKGEVYEPEPAPNGYRTIYLNTKNLWHSDNAKFFAHSWGANDSFQDVQLDFYIGYIYKVYIPNDHSNIVFVRMSPEATEFAWDSEYLWNQTTDLTIPANKDCYTIRGWGTDQGVWTTFGVDHNQDPLYSSSVPSACPDVMLQGFYWDSNQDKYYGCTRWWNLQKEAEEISSYFDLIWLPPSAMSSGGVGYHPKQYSNQNSDWGQRGELEYLIKQLHDGGTKVIADMVINHIDSKEGWCGFYDQDFGEYGYFQVDGSYISQDDEMNWDADEYCRGKATGAWEDGYGGESNYGAARDLAHGDEKVRQLCRAYAKWMVNVMKYDGFRYDYCKGFHMSHVNDYNANAGAYFSMIEYYDGNRDVLWSRIADAGENTLALDFAMKFNVMNAGIGQFNYSACKNPNSLIGMGKGKWAVNFIDNHDTFERGNNCDFGGSDPMSDGVKDRLLQANAYMLSMPGVPCVFYPHWKAHGAAIKPMILARKAVGVHSESAVSDEVVGNGYRAYVTGTKGTLILELGAACSSCPYGYIEVAAGAGYKMYITYECSFPELTISQGTTTYRTSTMSVTMNAVGLAGTPTIYYTLDGSDPKSSATKKTYSGAITISGNVTLKAYADVAGRQSEVQTCEYTYIPPQDQSITIAFQKPDTWQNVYLYSWDNAEEKLTGLWPGIRLTQTNLSGLYYYQFSDEQPREINFILHNNSGTQSADLLTYEDVCYGWENNAARLINCAENASTTIYHYGTDSQEDGVYEIEDEYVGALIYKRVFTPGKWETLYLPFEVEKVTVEDDGEYKLLPWQVSNGGNYYLAEQVGVQNGELYFDFTTTLEANQPYIIQFPDKDGYYDNRIVTFHGTRKWNELSTTFEPLKPTTQMKIQGNNTLLKQTLQDYVYVLRATSDFVLQRSATTLQPFECYVLPQQTTIANPASRMRVRLRGQDDDITTSLDTLSQLILDPTLPFYNILGQHVDVNYHGVVIQNGHKFIK